MKTKENYLLTIYKEHRNCPFNIYRLSGCGGCIEIEKRLYACMEEDLGIICNLNIYKELNIKKIMTTVFWNRANFCVETVALVTSKI